MQAKDRKEDWWLVEAAGSAHTTTHSEPAPVVTAASSCAGSRCTPHPGPAAIGQPPRKSGATQVQDITANIMPGVDRALASTLRQDMVDTASALLRAATL